MQLKSQIISDAFLVLGALVILAVLANNRPLPRLRVGGEGLITDKVHQTKGEDYLWLWGVKPGKASSSRVKLEFAHAAAGEEGGFRMMAFVDTSGDGRPDTEIARSEFLAAETDGGWSSFEFQAPAGKQLFVGARHGRAGAPASVYRSEYPWPNPNGPFENLFYHNIGPGKAQTAGPAHTNLRIRFLKQL